jgi:hypothetical protein
MNKKLLAILILFVSIITDSVAGIELSVSGGEGGESGSYSTMIDAGDEASVNGKITIDGATIASLLSMTGPIPLFEQTHGVTDTTGKHASVYVKVVNAPDGLEYNSRVLPSEGTVSAQPWVSAEQWLNVPKADYIKCTATASYEALSAEVGIEQTKGSLDEDYVTLDGYYGKAYSSDTLVYAAQTANYGSGSIIKIAGQSNDGNGSCSVNTQINGISGEKAIIQWLESLSSAGNITHATQKEHVHGEFTSTAATALESITRTSNYGTEYDLSMQAVNGSSPIGTLGYYVNPNMTTTDSGAIQGAVNASQSGDTINLYPGTYKENVEINKSLAVKGSGENETIVDGNQSGSVFTVGSQNSTNISVELSALTIQGGSGTPLSNESSSTQGSLLWSYTRYLGTGTLLPSEYNVTALYGGGILNYGNLVVKDSNISGNTADYGGGISNFGTATIADSSILNNTAQYGGGVFNRGMANIIGTNISANRCSHDDISYSPYGIWWPYLGSGGGIFNDIEGAVTVVDSSISGNIASGDGGGIDNLGTATILNSTIIGNIATGRRIFTPIKIFGYGDIPSYTFVDGRGGGIANSGSATMLGCTVSNNSADRGGGVHNIGTATISDSNVSSNTATYGGGIDNYGAYNTTNIFIPGTLNITDSIISDNNAYLRGGGIDNGGKLFIGGISQVINNQAEKGNGGGIFSTTSSVTFNGTETFIKSNKAYLPSTSEPTWYQGWGVYLTNGAPITTGGFDPATQVIDNVHV